MWFILLCCHYSSTAFKFLIFVLVRAPRKMDKTSSNEKKNDKRVNQRLKQNFYLCPSIDRYDIDPGVQASYP